MSPDASPLLLTPDYTLSAALSPESLYLHLRTPAACFQTTLTGAEMDGIMGQWLETLDELYECLRDEANVQVDAE